MNTKKHVNDPANHEQAESMDDFELDDEALSTIKGGCAMCGNPNKRHGPGGGMGGGGMGGGGMGGGMFGGG